MSQHGSSEDRYPPEEVARLQEIADLRLTAPETDEVLDRLTREAAETLGLPIALVSCVLDSVQYFPSSHGVEGWIAEARGTPKEWSFCQHAVSSKEAFIVEDAAKDERVKDSPLVSQDGIACYLGIPLVTSKGHAIGTLCVIGGEPRTFTQEERQGVEALAAQAIERIEARARS